MHCNQIPGKKIPATSSRRGAALFGTAVLALSSVARAVDIDVFGVGNTSAATRPNILFVLDNSANWDASASGAAGTKKFNAVVAALAATLGDAGAPEGEEPRYNIGLLMHTDNNGRSYTTPAAPAGGYIRAAIRPMNASNAAHFANLVQSLDITKDKGPNSVDAAVMMAEANAYFTLASPIAGRNLWKADHAQQASTVWPGSIYAASANPNARQIAASLAAVTQTIGGTTRHTSALASVNDTTYEPYAGILERASLPEAERALCPAPRNFIIFISNGGTQDTKTTTDAYNSELLSTAAAAAGLTVTSPLPGTRTGGSGNLSDEWAALMRRDPTIAVSTYAIEVIPNTTNPAKDWTSVLQNMAKVGNGRYVAVGSGGDTAVSLQNEIERILLEILGQNSVFASASLPIATQGSYLNEVYIGQFRPDTQARPRWPGNLKRYQIKDEAGQLRLADADGYSAIDTNTGFVDACARSFWTTDTASPSYWANLPSGSCRITRSNGVETPSATVTNLTNDKPDGNLVERGGQAQRSRDSTATRNMVYAKGFTAGSTSITVSDMSGVAATEVGVASTDLSNYRAWHAGTDNLDENIDAVVSAQRRPSLHGDVLHSKPAAINFGSDVSPNVVLFYGANDGLLRAVSGSTGQEFWAFMPQEFLSSGYKRIRDNTPLVSFQVVSEVDPTAQPKPYGPDGSVSAYTLPNGQRYIAATMRRGGRSVYIIKASSTTPTSSDVRWAGCIDNGASSVCSDAQLSSLGQTWSKPVYTGVSGASSGALFMGGGYDDCEDAMTPTCGSGSRGRGIYAIHPSTGAVLGYWSTEHAVAADVFIVRQGSADTTNAKFLYAVDLGGNVYRLNLEDGLNDASLVKIADLGCGSYSACTTPRKFMFTPDVVYRQGYYWLLIGSGDREKPLRVQQSGIQNYLFALRDLPEQTSWKSDWASKCSATAAPSSGHPEGAEICISALRDLDRATANGDALDIDGYAGWKLPLAANEDVVTTALTFFGVINFSTYIPYDDSATLSCQPALGTTTQYKVRLDASSVTPTVIQASVGLPPSPIGGKVILDPNEPPVPFCIGCSSVSPLEVERPQNAGVGEQPRPKRRSYWYIRQ